MTVIVMPDISVPCELLEKIEKHVAQVLFRHPSGRPWILSDGSGSAVGGGNGSIDIAIVENRPRKHQLDHILQHRKSITELDREAAECAEVDVLFFAREANRMRCQAPLFLTRALFWVLVGDVPVISDSQIALQQIAGLAPDPAVLASRLTNAELSHAFGLRSVWRGIHTAGPGEWLDSRSGAAPVPVRWWQPPAADRPVEELADDLREAIIAALTRRVSGHQEVSADLSGGLDSTTLNFFLVELGVKPHTLFLASDNVVNRDRDWAGRAASELGSRHHSVPYGTILPYLLDERTGTVVRWPEGPTFANSALASGPMIDDIMAGTGSTLHLNGHAGDALFGPVSTMLWSLVRFGGRQRYRKMWRIRVQNRYPLGATMRMILRGGSFKQDLERIAHHDFADREDDIAAYSRWVPLPRVHPVLTDAARDHLRGLAKDAVRAGTEPFSSDRTANQIVEYLTVHGGVMRRMNQAAPAQSGLTFDSPYLDRRVVELSLSLGIRERSHQYPAKPLLAAARPAGMSLDYFTRPDKGDYTAEAFTHHQAMKPVLRSLFADGSVLEQLGLISGERLRRLIGRYAPTGDTQTDLDNIAIAERWLRSVA